MSTIRISNAQMYHSVLRNVNSGTARLADLQEKLSTGRRVNRASDDPSAAVLALGYRSDIALNAQHQRATADALARMNASEAALGNATDTMQRARELALQAGSPSVSATEMANIAQEVDQLLNHLVQTGNTNYAGTYLFGGQQTQAAPFTTTTVSGEITTVSYAGDSGGLTREIGVGNTIDINIPGSTAFGNAFNSLITLREALQAGDAPAAMATVTTIDADIENLLNARARLGARVNSVEAADNVLTSANTDLQKQKADNEEIDLVDIVVRLNSQQNVYQASLASAAKVIQPSLITFLR